MTHFQSVINETKNYRKRNKSYEIGYTVILFCRESIFPIHYYDCILSCFNKIEKNQLITFSIPWPSSRPIKTFTSSGSVPLSSKVVLTRPSRSEQVTWSLGIMYIMCTFIFYIMRIWIYMYESDTHHNMSYNNKSLPQFWQYSSAHLKGWCQSSPPCSSPPDPSSHRPWHHSSQLQF